MRYLRDLLHHGVLAKAMAINVRYFTDTSHEWRDKVLREYVLTNWRYTPYRGLNY